MDVRLLLDMPAEGAAERIAVGAFSYREVRRRAGVLAGVLAAHPGSRLAFLGVNSPAMPIALFAAALAGKPFLPLNYRLPDDRLRAAAARCAPALLVVDADMAQRVEGIDGVELLIRESVPTEVSGEPHVLPEIDSDSVAVELFTSGTSSEPKMAMLRHRHLASYVLGTVDFLGAGEDECILVSVPPYHVAAVASILTAFYAGRRLVQLPSFDAESWVATATAERVTQAMVVPTMLGRILDVLDQRSEGLPALRHLSYGGGRMPLATVRRAMEMLPHVDFVNAYGLTETSSTVALLGPDDHRKAHRSQDPAEQARLGSVGRPLPSVEVQVRGASNEILPPREAGEIFVRGEQISGEYAGHTVRAGSDWFATRDRGYLDEDGYLFLEGRLDDVIVRGGENMSPQEIEEVLLDHPAIVDAAVVGVPHEEWGECIAACVVVSEPVGAEEVRQWVRSRLRSSKMPDIVEFLEALPYNETGKLLRRALREQLSRAEISRP